MNYAPGISRDLFLDCNEEPFVHTHTHTHQASKISVEPYWPGLFAKLFAKKNMDDLITNVGAGLWLCVCVVGGAGGGCWLGASLCVAATIMF